MTSHINDALKPSTITRIILTQTDCSSMPVLMFRNEGWFDLDRRDKIPLNSIRIHLVELLATFRCVEF